MCYYITAILPKGTKVESLHEILNKYDMAFDEIENSSIRSKLEEGDLYLRATKAYCDCNTILGSKNLSQEYQSLLKSKKVKKLRKMKWTEQQIDDWIKEKIGKKDKNKLKILTEHEKELECDRWLHFIEAIIYEGKVLRFGILKHWYTHSLKDEEIDIKVTQKINVGNLNRDLLLTLEEDFLYEFINY